MMGWVAVLVGEEEGVALKPRVMMAVSSSRRESGTSEVEVDEGQG